PGRSPLPPRRGRADAPGGGRHRPPVHLGPGGRHAPPAALAPGRHPLMPRDIPIGNGSLLVTFDLAYNLRDVYFPRVGQENHTAGHACRFGVWVDGDFSWLDGDD